MNWEILGFGYATYAVGFECCIDFVCGNGFYDRVNDFLGCVGCEDLGFGHGGYVGFGELFLVLRNGCCSVGERREKEGERGRESSESGLSKKDKVVLLTVPYCTYLTLPSKYSCGGVVQGREPYR